MTRKESIIWAAGFIEGEGYFTIKKAHKRLKNGERSSWRGYVLGVSQVNKEPLLRLQELFGGRLHDRTKVNADGIPRRPWTGWELSNREAVLEATRLIAPYLSEDRKQRIPWLAEALRNDPAASAGTDILWESDARNPDPTPLREAIQDPERYRLYSLCPCENCSGTGKVGTSVYVSGKPNATHAKRCPDCRGEGRKLSLVATTGTKEGVGTALVTLALEGHWDGDCPFGLMHRPEGEKGRWLIKPWQASARNVSDAARTLARSKNPVTPS